MKKILTMLVCLTLGACASNQHAYKFKYPYNKQTLAVSVNKTPYNIYVEDFSDYRGDDRKEISVWNGMLLNPSFELYWDRPENGNQEEVSFIERRRHINNGKGYLISIENDLKNATSLSLKKSKLFNAISNINNKCDFVLQGRVLDFKFKSKEYLYGLSGFSFVPQLLGLPIKKNTEIIRVTFSLLDNKTNKIIFNKTYMKTKNITVRVYSLKKEETLKGFEELYQQINNELILDLDLGS